MVSSKKKEDDIAFKLLLSTLHILTKSVKDVDVKLKYQDRLLTRLCDDYQILEHRVDLLERHIEDKNYQ